MFSSRKTGSASNNYLLTRSLRFRSSASAYLNRTPASAGNRRTWTWSAWVKRGALSSDMTLFNANPNSGYNGTWIRLLSGNTLEFAYLTGVGYTPDLVTSAVFRDPSAWYHIVVAVDTTQATDTNRVKIYVNNVLQTVTVSGVGWMAPNTDLDVNNTVDHNIFRRNSNSGGGVDYTDGYLTENYLIDGQALTPSSFGSTNAATGVWQPIKYTGTYGTNGFYLPFTDTTSTTTLGNDSSGNGNNWTTNNISLTAGTTYDSMTDVPTNTSATVANYCVLNPLFKQDGNTSATYGSMGTPSQANLQAILSAGQNVYGSISTSANAGKWYAEFTASSITSDCWFGFMSSDGNLNRSAYISATSGVVVENASKSTAGFSANDVIGIALDTAAFTIQFYKNGSAIGSLYAISTAIYTQYFWCYTNSGATVYLNFGQRPFTYTPPSGFVALNTFNLPTPTIGATASTQANDYFDVTTYTGTGSSQSITNSGSMQPDFVWIKGRSGATDHGLYDAVRGVQKQLESNNTDAETTETTGLTAFNSNGFTVGALAQLNTSSATYVGWQWKANGSGSSNTAGSITSTVSANTTAGFSVVIYTGTGANATVGHGLGVAPSFIIAKKRSSTGSWQVYASAVSGMAGGYLTLNGTSGFTGGNSTIWNNTAPTSSVFSLGTDTDANASGATTVAYCWAEVAGFSKFGSYTGNGSSDGPFVYTGFRPRFFMIKRTDTTTNWIMYDTARQPYNTTNPGPIYANLSSAEESNTTLTAFDILSNGFKPRNTSSWAESNASGGTYIYMAFAESPFKYANAR